MTNYRYVANSRVTVSGDDLRLSKIGPEDYRLEIRKELHRGPTTRLVGLSEDDCRALYLMLDEIVGTFKTGQRKACSHDFEERYFQYDSEFHTICKNCGHMP